MSLQLDNLVPLLVHLHRPSRILLLILLPILINRPICVLFRRTHTTEADVCTVELDLIS
jgi:hypothetical protein